MALYLDSTAWCLCILLSVNLIFVLILFFKHFWEHYQTQVRKMCLHVDRLKCFEVSLRFGTVNERKTNLASACEEQRTLKWFMSPSLPTPSSINACYFQTSPSWSGCLLGFPCDNEVLVLCVDCKSHCWVCSLFRWVLALKITSERY